MQVTRPSSRVIAFVRPQEGANASLVETDAGPVVVDTTSCAGDMQCLLDSVGKRATDVQLVINTHQHSDHTWGNQLFSCPILAHRLCHAAMAANLEGAWQIERIRASIAARGESDPAWADEMRKIAGLQVTLPTDLFDDRRAIEVGGVRIDVIHAGGHTPGSSVVWLPNERVLFAGDLLFVERYPFIGDADIPDLIAVLKRLPAYGAEAIVPGHGPLCGEAGVRAMLAYVEGTWARTIEHLAQGHSADEAAADPGYPRYADGAAERYHELNIRTVYAQLASGDACPV
ncbi:MAG: MBL fold metallo-hydrolase [Anaerolineae bacterium]|nr:MBL fold metallo-hydrolase [Anaerolineae bacterium]